jgi:polysaccharide export outer membrane protein
MQKNISSGIQITILALVLIFANSCVPVKQLKYFNDIDELQEPIINPKKTKLIMPFDYLYIRVFSIDEKTNQLFNSSTNLPASSSSTMAGYLVDGAGNINYPFVGNINLSGLTPMDAGLKLEKALTEHVGNAAVSVSFLENKVTVMGEVQRTGTYPFTQDKLNIYEALALSGGITKLGDHKKVILIRQEGDKIMHHKLDLSDSKIAGKDYYYIQSNDIIVVEPSKFSSWFTFNSSSFATILSSVTSLLALYVILFR